MKKGGERQAMKFEKLISMALNSPCSEVYFLQIVIVNRGEADEWYIGRRTWENPDWLRVVLPFRYHNRHYWYICPDCGKIHATEYLGKQQTGCCEDIDCQRIQRIGGEYVFIQRNPVIVSEVDET